MLLKKKKSQLCPSGWNCISRFQGSRLPCNGNFLMGLRKSHLFSVCPAFLVRMGMMTSKLLTNQRWNWKSPVKDVFIILYSRLSLGVRKKNVLIKIMALEFSCGATKIGQAQRKNVLQELVEFDHHHLKLFSQLSVPPSWYTSYMNLISCLFSGLESSLIACKWLKCTVMESYYLVSSTWGRFVSWLPPF